VNKRVRVLSGGERTRLAVARMLLRPSNTLLLDEPTNHLDLDSKEVLLDALVDYGGTLIFVSHDRYFVERLATKIVEVGRGQAVVYPGTYTEFLWHKQHADEGQAGRAGQARQAGREGRAGQAGGAASALRASAGQGGARGDSGERRPGAPAHVKKQTPTRGSAPGRGEREAERNPREQHEAKKKADAETKRKSRELQARRARIETLEARIAETEQALRELEQAMAVPGFFDDREASKPIIEKHQALMWQVGDLMHQWEELQSLSDTAAADADGTVI